MEVRNLVVASFGKKGNIRLLHEFDQLVTGEAGVKVSVLEIIKAVFRSIIFGFNKECLVHAFKERFSNFDYMLTFG